jgi:hypothetical protein
MITKLSLLLVFGLFLSGVSAEYIDLNEEDLYCSHYGIWFWCSESGIETMEGLSPDFLAQVGYINEYAFSDDMRYNGDLRIIDLDVTANLDRTSNVEAIYMIHNKGDEPINVHINALATPENTKLYVDGTPVSVDPLLDGWDLNFVAGEQKGVRLVIEEPLYGNIYGYNVNLIFDGKTVDNHITPTGTIEFTLPAGATLSACAPSGYSQTTANGRIAVTWTRTDFVPWTNPFNDLICSWDMGAQTTAPEEEMETEGDSPIVWMFVILLVIGILAYLWKSDRLYDLIHRE